MAPAVYRGVVLLRPHICSGCTRRGGKVGTGPPGAGPRADRVGESDVARPRPHHCARGGRSPLGETAGLGHAPRLGSESPVPPLGTSARSAGVQAPPPPSPDPSSLSVAPHSSPLSVSLSLCVLLCLASRRPVSRVCLVVVGLCGQAPGDSVCEGPEPCSALCLPSAGQRPRQLGHLVRRGLR